MRLKIRRAGHTSAAPANVRVEPPPTASDEVRQSAYIRLETMFSAVEQRFCKSVLAVPRHAA